MTNTLKLLVLTCLLLSVFGCATEPAGPGEQIGKGIDMITKGLQDMQPEESESARLERQREEDARQRELDRQERERYYNQGGMRLNDGTGSDDWSSRNKY